MRTWFRPILTAFLILWSATGFTQQPQFTIHDYEYAPTAVLALSLARSGNIIPEADMAEVIASLEEHGTVPRRFRAQFEKLMHVAQMLLEIKAATSYFPVGYEFETGHHTQDSLEDFEKGAKAIARSVKETFGTKGAPQFSSIVKEGDAMERADVKDDSGGTWSIVQEYVRDDYRSTTPTGWETVSPPIFNRDYLRNMAGFILRLGSNPYGREAEFTGAHQTYDILPQGVAFEPGLAGRTVANYLLMMEQFAPAIFKNLQVERYGGYKNFFIRPIVLDHATLLREISATSPETMTIQYLERLMNGKYATVEFNSHVVHTAVYDESDRRAMLAWSDAKKAKFPKLWKYHDLRIHFNPAKPERTLVETRIGDYRQGAPEEILRVTYFNQMLLERAYQLAKENKVFQVDIPERQKGETEDGYWKRLAGYPAASDEAMFAALKLDEVARRLVKGETFEPRPPKFTALPRPSYGFEKEFIGQEIIDLIVPKDPEARARWRSMSFDEKVEYFANLIADTDMRENFLHEEYLEYTKDTRRIITMEFEADTMKYPFLDPDLFIEDSGNFEIKSNGRDIYDIDTLVSKLQITGKKLDTTTYGMHAHLFIPDSLLRPFRSTSGLAEAAGSFLERLSLLMQVEDYRNSTGSDHALDSWSLDRYSQKDIKQFVQWLKGRGKLGNIDQKYHNVGVREVKGGLDIELRAVGEDIPYMKELMTYVSKAFIAKEFGYAHRYGQNRPIFHDFTKATDMAQVRQFMLVDAVAKRHPLTPAQRDILYKLQFEIYKPSMAEYVFFDDFMAHNSVDADKMDTRYVRSNFESNVALPILNYDDQPYMNQKGMDAILKAREKFLEKVYQLAAAIEKDPKFKFMQENKDFLHLADWLERSKHPSRPDFSKVDKKTAGVQRRSLESLVKKLRGFVVEFSKSTEIPEMIRVSFDAEKAKTAIQPMPLKKLDSKAPEARATQRPGYTPAKQVPTFRQRSAPQSCEDVFRPAA